MKIVKKFDVEMAHIVRNAWSGRCARSLHGHTYTIELVIERIHGGLFDAGRMIIDFGLIKEHLGPFVDSFDHATLLWSKDPDEDMVGFLCKHSDRVIVCDESSSCEMMAALILAGCNRLIDHTTELQNVKVTSVIVHETKTGRAICNHRDDWVSFVHDTGLLNTIHFSPAIQGEWPLEFVHAVARAGIGKDNLRTF